MAEGLSVLLLRWLVLQALAPLLAQHLAEQQHLEHHQQQQAQEHSFLSEKLTVLLLLQEPSAWGTAELWADPAQLEAWKHLLDASAVSILDGEVGYLRQQLHHIEDVLQESGGGSSSSDGQGAIGCNSCSASLPGGSSFPAIAAAALAAPAAAGGDAAGNAAQQVHGIRGVQEGGAGGSSSSPCSSCSFQQDCSLKGCVNQHGEVEVQAHGGAIRHALQQQGSKQQGQGLQQQPAAGEFSSHGCCSTGHGEYVC